MALEKVAAFIGSENVAVTLVLTDCAGAPFAGVTLLTVGGVVSAPTVVDEDDVNPVVFALVGRGGEGAAAVPVQPVRTVDAIPQRVQRTIVDAVGGKVAVVA